jgi:hypothetical protein
MDTKIQVKLLLTRNMIIWSDSMVTNEGIVTP